MKNIIVVVLTAMLLSVSFIASAQTQVASTEASDDAPSSIVVASSDDTPQLDIKKDEVEEVFSNEVEVRYYRNGDPSIKGYFEKSLTDDWALYLSAYKSRGWEEITAGPVYYITPEMSVGIGVGSSRYMADHEIKKSYHATVSAFWFLKSENWEAEILAERYRNDKTNPTYFEGYAQRKVTDNLSVGFYAQKDIGWGPRIHYSISKNVSIWVSPIVNRFEGSDVTAIVGISVSF